MNRFVFRIFETKIDKIHNFTGCSPIVFESQKSPKRSSRRRNNISRSNQQVISDSEESQDVQEERRVEFEKFRNQKKMKRKPQFAIGQPLSNDNLKISALFPRYYQIQTSYFLFHRYLVV